MAGLVALVRSMPSLSERETPSLSKGPGSLMLPFFGFRFILTSFGPVLWVRLDKVALWSRIKLGKLSKGKRVDVSGALGIPGRPSLLRVELN